MYRGTSIGGGGLGAHRSYSVDEMRINMVVILGGCRKGTQRLLMFPIPIFFPFFLVPSPYINVDVPPVATSLIRFFDSCSGDNLIFVNFLH